ncbi:MAG: TetR family transcriptional regulator [Curvibacter lanceolatus]|jgi:AcrR family transcriptional regulator|uniref:TetR family transcriptional regulator n=1 Tax=Curvibacter lanceolatus TaxID=86182 RepID=UPI000373395D|nr:TetR family transcriptional regulator [Curvibacter lanceolatus]MBV5293348.1 TetR family transcriptional regulator [Curvibacter lanceolatus]
MKRSRAGALRTREAILAAALQAFARHGISGASFQHVAELAGVTRGAVYWHFTDRVSLLREVFLGLQWPLDIGPDLQPYLQCHNPLALLRETLAQRIDRCLADPRQRSLVALLLSQQRCSPMPPELPPDLVAQLERQVADASVRLVEVCALAEARGLLRVGCQPQVLGSCLHALALDCLRGHCLAWAGGSGTWAAGALQHRQAIAWLLQGAALSQT